MIEINLLPGSTSRKSSKKGKAARRPTGGGFAKPKLPEFDRTRMFMVGGWVFAVALIGWLHFSTTAELNALRTENEAAVRDSTRFAMLRAQGDSLMAQEKAIGQKLQVIQEIDASRFIWPHILDEISRALPAYVWVVNLTEAASADGTRFRVEARAGNYFALARYIEDLEASPFLKQVRLISSQQTRIEERTVLGFIFEASYQEPPPDAIHMVPLFGTVSQEN